MPESTQTHAPRSSVLARKANCSGGREHDEIEQGSISGAACGDAADVRQRDHARSAANRVNGFDGPERFHYHYEKEEQEEGSRS
jgi:hypothetical protein